MHRVTFWEKKKHPHHLTFGIEARELAGNPKPYNEKHSQTSIKLSPDFLPFYWSLFILVNNSSPDVSPLNQSPPVSCVHALISQRKQELWIFAWDTHQPSKMPETATVESGFVGRWSRMHTLLRFLRDTIRKAFSLAGLLREWSTVFCIKNFANEGHENFSRFK